MIELQNISFKYEEKYIFHNVSKKFELGVVHGIVGFNGAGKSTFFNLLAGYRLPDNGSIALNNIPINKRNMAFLETDLYFYPNLSAREFLSIFTKSNENFNETAFSEIFNIPLDELISNYSTGMKKKLMLMTHIKQNKEIFILDEPFNGLDIESSATLECIITILKEKGKTVFISSHIFSSLLDICDMIHYINDGNIDKTFQKTEFQKIQSDIFGKQNSLIKHNLKDLL